MAASRLRFREGNRIRLYEDGPSALEEMLAAVATATEHVELETYIFRPDVTGRRFLDALVAAAERGATVRLLVDGFGCHATPSDWFAPLSEAGGDFAIFNPLPRLWPRLPLRRRDHRKILVVDGRRAFLGGLNLGDEYGLVPPRGAPWRDTQVEVAGPVVRDIEAVFLEGWLRADAPGPPWPELWSPPAAEDGSARCAVLADGPSYHRRRTRRLLLEGLAEVRERVALATPYLAPGRRVLDALVATARRGVRVDLLLAGQSDHPTLRHAAHYLLPRLLACGVRVYEYTPAMMHAKVALFDRRFAVVGTSNLDRQSFEHSYEVNLVVEDADFCTRIEAGFARDIALSREWTTESFAGRHLFERAIDRLAALALRII